MSKWWQPSPAPTVTRTREFIPNDAEFRTPDEINARVDELIEKRLAMDPVKQFVGIKRLGDSFTIAEPFAYFDEPTYEEAAADRYLIGGIFVAAMLTASTVSAGIGNFPVGRAIARTALISPILFALGAYGKHLSMQNALFNKNVYFHYAIMKEKTFPIIERKKFGDIILDWTAHRSLNNLSKEYGF